MTFPSTASPPERRPLPQPIALGRLTLLAGGPPQTGPAAAAPPGEVLVGRLHLVACLAFVGAGLWQVSESGVSWAGLVAAFGWIVVGGFCLLILGTSRMLLAGVLAQPIAGPRWLAYVPGLAVATGAMGFASTQAPPALAWAWSAGMAVHIAVVAATIRGWWSARRRQLPMAGRSPGLGGAVMVGALLHAFAAALVLPAAAEGFVAPSVAVHLVLTGFVVGTIVGVSLVILPRFARLPVPAWMTPSTGSLCLVGPALLAWGLASDTRVFQLGAVVEGAGLGSFALLVLWMVLRSGRFRPSFLAYAAAAVSILTGLLLGVLFAFDPATRALVPVHGALNLFGFAGLFVVGASIDLYGPSIRAHPTWFRFQSWIVVGLAAAGTAMLAWEGAGGPRGTGVLLYGLAVGPHFVGAARSAWRDLTRRTRDPSHDVRKGRVRRDLRAG